MYIKRNVYKEKCAKKLNREKSGNNKYRVKT